MSSECLSHNELVESCLAGVGRGDFTDYEVAGIFSGRFDQPLQFALRHLETLRVILVDCDHDGTIRLPDKPPCLAAAA